MIKSSPKTTISAPEKLLTDVAAGKIPKQYRGAIQRLIKQNNSLLRAIYFHELLQQPDKYPHPIRTAMRDLNASRATIYLNFRTYKNLFKTINH